MQYCTISTQSRYQLHIAQPSYEHTIFLQFQDTSVITLITNIQYNKLCGRSVITHALDVAWFTNSVEITKHPVPSPSGELYTRVCVHALIKWLTSLSWDFNVRFFNPLINRLHGSVDIEVAYLYCLIIGASTVCMCVW